MFNLSNLLFFITLMISTLITISSQSWLGMWLGLEINLLSFIPLMNSNKNMMNTEASIKYFIVQAIASTIFLMSIILMSSMIMNKYLIYMAFNTALFIKMGAAPFHFWFPEIIEGMNWFNSLILLTWQKIAPMVLITYSMNIIYTQGIIVVCMIISGWLGINQISIRKILAYSSINHIGWMLLSMMYNQIVWMHYFLFYSLMTINVILILKSLNVFFLKQLFDSMKTNKLMKLMFMMNFFSLGGLPPFIGFFPKWITIQAAVTNNLYVLPIIMIVFTLISLFMYLRLTFTTIILSSTENKTILWQTNNSTLLMIVTFMTIGGLIMSTMMFSLI